MSALSGERLAEIRGALNAPNIKLRGDPYEAILRTAGMADDLLAEVERFRAEVGDIRKDAMVAASLGRSPSEKAPFRNLARRCAALLNPTEGARDR